MFCIKCGTQIPDESKFCYKCGTPVVQIEQKDKITQAAYDTVVTDPASVKSAAPQQQQYSQPAQQQSTAPSKADDGIFGILGFVFAFIFPVVGLILSVIGVNRKKNSGFAVAGILVSIVIIVLTIFLIVLLVERYNHYDFYPYFYY